MTDRRTAFIVDVEHFLPEGKLTNEALSREFPEWSNEKIGEKTGIKSRHIVSGNQGTKDLALGAVEKLFGKAHHEKGEVDFVIACTQTNDYVMPALSNFLQNQAGLRTSVGAIDVNQGCSGYLYGLSLAKGLIESGQAENILLVTADTYSRLLNESDKVTRTIFGDGASATLVSARSSEAQGLTAFKFGTDGSGAGFLMTPSGNIHGDSRLNLQSSPTERGLNPGKFDLFMDGPEIFSFTLREIPPLVSGVLEEFGSSLTEIDMVIPHQANRFMLEHLRDKLGVGEEKFLIDLEETGNTVSSSIPIALSRLIDRQSLQPGSHILLLGFGVGLSWAGAVVRWENVL